jgi:hypothetical protein
MFPPKSSGTIVDRAWGMEMGTEMGTDGNGDGFIFFPAGDQKIDLSPLRRACRLAMGK